MTELPKLFLDRMKRMLGDQYEAFLASYGKPHRPTLRVNTLKLAPDELRAIAPFCGDPVPWQENGMYYPDSDEVRPGKHPFHEMGLYYIQEASAMIPASLRAPRKGERVLDLCAAPGGKTTQLAAALGGEGLLVANEIHPARAAILAQNVERMGIANALVTNESPEALSKHFPAFFDMIVVDAPCSGEGMFRKEDDAVAMWSPDNVSLCAARQADILEEAAKMLSIGGYMVYSTCTFAPEENEGTLVGFLLSHPEFEVVEPESSAVLAARDAGLIDRGRPEWVSSVDIPDEKRASLAEQVSKSLRLFPHHADGEGHFAVLLRKTAEGDTPAPKPNKDKRKGGKPTGGKPMPSLGKGAASPDAAAQAAYTAFAEDMLSTAPSGTPCLFGDHLYLLPAALEGGRQALEGIHVLRAGLCAGEIKGKRFEPAHALALSLRASDAKQVFPLESVEGMTPAEAASAYLHGSTLPAPDRRGWHLVTLAGYPIGWGKASDGILKNHYPKGLRKP